MEKEGKADIISVLIASIVIFVVYAVFASGELSSGFPLNNTNASSTQGIAASGFANMIGFNASLPVFNCTVAASNASLNVTRVVLYINRSSNISGADGVTPDLLINDTAIANATQGPNATGAAPFNVTFNLTSSFDEGTYMWMCQWEDNTTTPNSGDTTARIINFSGTNYFIIDKTPPVTTNSNVTNTSNAKLSTEDTVYIAANFSDKYTIPHTVRLLVNFSGVNDNVVDVNTSPDNNTLVNLSFIVTGNQSANTSIGTVLNVTLWVNDSVGNYNITPALVFTIEGDGTPPDPINLTDPIDLFNQSSTTAPTFNFTAFDNNDTNFNCNISLTVGGSFFTNISDLNVTSGVAHQNTTSVALINGTYTWNVTCIDGAGNTNTSIGRTFTVDNIPPVFDYYNFTNNATINTSSGTVQNVGYQLGQNDSNSRIQIDANEAKPDSGKIHFIANFTDNLTQPLQGALQFFNSTSGSWQTLNNSPSNYKASENSSWINLSYRIPVGHNEFEGRNITFRLVANDSLGNLGNNFTQPFKNFTIRINDTTPPTITINGTIEANNTNTTNARPLVSWAVVEGNFLDEINVSVDNVLSGCNKFKKFTIPTQDDGDANANRNGSFEITDSGACTLGNGTHSFIVKARDSWGNVEVYYHNFTVRSGISPVLAFNLTNLARTAPHSKNSINASNITSTVGIQLFGTTNDEVGIDKISYVSSCDSSTTVVVSNYTTVYPFNDSTCPTTSANRTLTITINDTAGNSATNITTFLVDNVAPSLTVSSPKEGENFVNVNASFNLSALDDDQAISFFGYYLDGSNAVQTINISSTAIGDFGGAGINFTAGKHVNATGTHTIKFTVNDTLGNVKNSSEITFTQLGPLDFATLNQSIKDNNFNTTNVSFLDTNGNLLGSAEVNQTIQLFMNLNKTNERINLTVNFNGSAANWNFTTFIVAKVNDTIINDHVRNNQTATINRSLFFNTSFQKFLPNNNSYFAKIRFDQVNVSNGTGQLNPSFGSKFQLWFFSDEGDMSSKENITQCSAGFGRTTSSPCWNESVNGSVDVYVPHFSVLVYAEDLDAPTINVTQPHNFSNQSISMFAPNITVSADTVDCKYIINGSTSNFTMTKSGNVCIGQTERFKNIQPMPDVGYNITFFATDTGNNINTYIVKFNMSDGTKPIGPNETRVSSSVGETSATITVSDMNETVNATVLYGTAITTLTSNAVETDFNTTQAVSLSSLSASTLYYYNVSVCDFNGNCIQNGTFNLTTSAAAAAESAAAAASSGGGGGGGAAAVSTVSDSKAQIWSSLPAGSSFSLDVDKSSIAVTSVATNDIKSELNNVELEVQALTANPVSTEAAAKVFQYFRINKKNLKDTDAGSFKISFRVTKSWLSDNSLASGDISLYRFANNEWNELTTRVTGTDSVYVNYEADTPGFSSFAIGVKSGAVEEAPVEEEAPEAAPEEEAPPEAVERPVPVEAPSKAPVAWIIAAVVVILGIILIVMYQKKKQQG